MVTEALQPRVAVLKFPATNCDEETAFAFDQAGGNVDTILLSQLRNGEVKLSDFQIVALPGGFSFADDLGSGTIAGLQLDTYLGNQIEEFKEKGIMIGICNGDQILTRSGLLPFGTLGERAATLDRNDSGKFLSRRINLKLNPDNKCVFLQDLEMGAIELQTAHGEGKLVTATMEDLDAIEQNGQVVFRYVDLEGNPTQEYPHNPSGSPNGIAAVCDPSGHILGIMPHPERSILRTQYPNWRRLPEDFTPQGKIFFDKMVDYAKQGL